jgi:hypothetical protein
MLENRVSQTKDKGEELDQSDKETLRQRRNIKKI